MIIVNKVISELYQENSYIVFDDTLNTGIVIDPGYDFDSILEKINNIKIKAVLLTHGHFDHIASCKKFQDIGIKVYISENDASMCCNNIENFSSYCNCYIENFVPDILISNKDEFIEIDSIHIKIIHVPGHSRGGLAFVIDKYLFSGDTLFFSGYGRTDLFGGSDKDIVESVKLLKTFIDNGYILCPGHDY